MKKSQLRNIIKGVIREQDKNKLRHIRDVGYPPNSHINIDYEDCDGIPSSATSNNGWQCNGQMCTSSDIDTPFIHPWSPNVIWILKAFSNPTTNTTGYANLIPTTCPSVSGCMDPAAPNYDPTATVDDGSCTVPGCTDSSFANYDPNATFDDGSCSDCDLRDLYDYIMNTVPYQNLFSVPGITGAQGQAVTIAHFCEACYPTPDPNNITPMGLNDPEHCKCCDPSSYGDQGCIMPYSEMFYSMPLSTQQGCTEFDTMYGPIPPNPPVNSQWTLNNGYAMGGCSIYYPSQNAFCEMCAGIDAFTVGGHPIQQYVGNPSAAGTSPVGSPYWLINHNACGCCP